MDQHYLSSSLSPFLFLRLKSFFMAFLEEIRLAMLFVIGCFLFFMCCFDVCSCFLQLSSPLLLNFIIVSWVLTVGAVLSSYFLTAGFTYTLMSMGNVAWRLNISWNDVNPEDSWRDVLYANTHAVV